MKSLLTVTAVFEAFTGLALVAAPSVVVSLLLGASLTEPSGMLVCRLTGTALLSLAIACWLSRGNTQSSVIIVKAFVFYNFSAALLLVYAALIEHFSGIGLWPAVVLHTGLLVWCLVSALNKIR